MRIDPNYGPQGASENDRTGAQNGTVSNNSSLTSIAGGLAGEDSAHLSGAHVQVAALAAQASQLPEIRQERVQSLRQTVQRGEYNPPPEQVAGSLVEAMMM
jgi:flagellar biosynthesis anti-sigma factor FlgM